MGRTPLHFAAEKGKSEILHQLLSLPHPLNVNEQDDESVCLTWGSLWIDKPIKVRKSEQEKVNERFKEIVFFFEGLGSLIFLLTPSSFSLLVI